LLICNRGNLAADEASKPRLANRTQGGTLRQNWQHHCECATGRTDAAWTRMGRFN
jgi:hypothetical protein